MLRFVTAWPTLKPLIINVFDPPSPKSYGETGDVMAEYSQEPLSAGPLPRLISVQKFLRMKRGPENQVLLLQSTDISSRMNLAKRVRSCFTEAMSRASRQAARGWARGVHLGYFGSALI